ncbi:DNA methyltransferase [Burkholderia multivorans]|uniref:DNA methyltransferase n=1 Tax=Burkholderia multivorans TaxID=87883 RepID=UPI0020B19F75|nr:DNA methyltransferase [Burkholderia multivorans]
MTWLNHSHRGDCRDLMRAMIADGVRVQTIVTSPPYWGLRSYLPDGHPDKHREIGQEPTLREFIDTLVGVFDLACELLADDGTLWLNMGDSYAGSRGGPETASTLNGTRRNQAEAHRAMTASRRRDDAPVPRSDVRVEGLKPKDLAGQPWRLAFALQEAGWYLRQDIIWHKPNPMPESVRDRCTKAHEYLFPSRMAQFCTYYLKTEPLNEYALNLIDETSAAVWSWQGVRIEESEARRNRLQGTGACVRSFEEVGGGLFIYRPVLRWTVESVFEAHRVAGIRPNPLYLQGRKRVGCLCINAGKDEIRQWDLRDRDHIAMLAEWENIVSDASKRGNSTFFPAPGETDTARERGNIWQVVEWSKTTRGGRQYDLLADAEPATACSSAYGLCE